MTALTFKAVLFDLDGTLLDTAPDLIASLNHVLRQNNMPECEAANAREHVSNGAIALLKFGFGPHYAKFKDKQLRKELLNYYADNLAEKTALFEGYEQVLQAYAKAKIPWGIVTNKPSFLTHPLLSLLKSKHPVLEQCSCTFASDSYVTRKPFSTGLLNAAACLGTSPQETVYVGDSIRDILAGKYASMHTIAACYGYVDTACPPSAWNADLQIKRPLDLLKLI